jgi:hypothetical protein
MKSIEKIIEKMQKVSCFYYEIVVKYRQIWQKSYFSLKCYDEVSDVQNPFSERVPLAVRCLVDGYLRFPSEQIL